MRRTVGIEIGEWCALAAVMLAALALRLCALEHIPAVLGHDECDNLVNTYQILNGRGPGFFGFDWKPQPAASVYLLSLLMHLNPSILALRLPAALFGVATLVPFYLLLRRAVGAPAALLAAALLATDIWYLHFSRTGWDNVYVCVFLMAAIAFLDRALERGRLRWFAATGACAAVGAYGYFSGRSILPAVLSAELLALGYAGLPRRRVAAGILLTLAVALIIFLPQGLSAVDRWETFQQRTRTVYLFGGENREKPLLEKVGMLRESFDRKAYQLFSATGPPHEGYVRSEGGVFPLPVRLLLALGLLVGAFRFRETWLWWLFLFVTFGTTQVLATGDLNGARGLVVVPVLYLFAGAAIEALWQLCRRIYRPLTALLVLAVLVLSISTALDYFRWIQSPRQLEAMGPSIPVSEFPAWQAFQLDWTAQTSEFFNLSMWEERKRGVH